LDAGDEFNGERIRALSADLVDKPNCGWHSIRCWIDSAFLMQVSARRKRDYRQ